MLGFFVLFTIYSTVMLITGCLYLKGKSDFEKEEREKRKNG